MKLDTVLFDMGGTLEEIKYVADAQAFLPKRLEQVLGLEGSQLTRMDIHACYARLKHNYASYRAFREETCVEVHPAMVWRDWILKDFTIADDVIFDHCEELAHVWETEVITRRTRDGIEQMLDALARRDIHMGVISNTGSFTQVHESLKQYGIKSYFEVIVLSSELGIRKPHPYIFHHALKSMQRDALRSMYVGDTISRDVIGARNAGLLKTVQIASEFTKLSDDASTGGYRPDYVIHSLMDLVPIIDEINET